ERLAIIEELNPLSHQQVYFTKIEYASPYHLFTKEPRFIEHDCNMLLVCGIANPKPLKEMLTNYTDTYEMILFSDHHIFSIDDLAEIKKQFLKIESSNKLILTTEKDGVRLAKFENELRDLPIYVLPMRHKFLFGEEEKFDANVIAFVESFDTTAGEYEPGPGGD
ncbi:MAG: tetraacyldisaccharide 4'-kinase, partial [Ginsengibacter sp.]